MMRVLAVSDLHGYLPHIPDCELLLLGGDYCPTRNTDMEYRFINGPFREWLKELVPRIRYVVGIAGNHDFILEQDETLAKSLPWLYLQNQAVELETVKIYGTPNTPYFGNWAFMRTEDELADIFQNIPEGLDILLTHGPGKGYLDLTREGVHAGSTSLIKRIKEVKPDSVVCGHIHEARGIQHDGDTRYYNVSYVNRDLEPQFNPASITLKV
jgi:Icc-related predicted phosphoesterase